MLCTLPARMCVVNVSIWNPCKYSTVSDRFITMLNPGVLDAFVMETRMSTGMCYILLDNIKAQMMGDESFIKFPYVAGPLTELLTSP